MPSIDKRSSSRSDGTVGLTGGVWYGPRLMPLLLPFGGVMECVTEMRPQLVADQRRHHDRRGGDRGTDDVDTVAREPTALGHVELVARPDRRPADGLVLREVDVDLLAATTEFKVLGIAVGQRAAGQGKGVVNRHRRVDGIDTGMVNGPENRDASQERHFDRGIPEILRVRADQHDPQRVGRDRTHFRGPELREHGSSRFIDRELTREIRLAPDAKPNHVARLQAALPKHSIVRAARGRRLGARITRLRCRRPSGYGSHKSEQRKTSDHLVHAVSLSEQRLLGRARKTRTVPRLHGGILVMYVSAWAEFDR